MQKYRLFLTLTFIIFLIISCKTITVLPTNKPIKDVNVIKLIDKINSTSFSFKNLKARIKATYFDGKNKQQVIVQTRIKFEEVIWFSATMVIPIAKMLISPDNVKFYEKFQKTYFEGNFDIINSYVNTDLGFKEIQNLLLGRPLTNFKNSKWKQISNQNQYILLSQGNKNPINPTLFFNPVTFLLEEERILIPGTPEILRIQYSNYTNIENKNLPQTIKFSLSKDDVSKYLIIEFTGIDFPEELSFPFEIPEGYKKIKI